MKERFLRTFFTIVGLVLIPGPVFADINEVQGPYKWEASDSTFYSLLRTAKLSAVGACLQGHGHGEFEDRIVMRTPNGILRASEQIEIRQDGTFTYHRPAHAEPKADDSVTFERLFECTIVDETFAELKKEKFFEKLKGVDQLANGISCGSKDKNGRRPATILFHQGISLEELGGEEICNRGPDSPDVHVKQWAGPAPGKNFDQLFLTHSPHGRDAVYTVFKGSCEKFSASELLTKCRKGYFSSELERASKTSGLELWVGIDSPHSGGFLQ